MGWHTKPLVLIVDDDADFVSDLAIMLSSEFEIRSASNTREACDSWLEFHPDCILLDLNLPGYFSTQSEQEGLAFLEHLRTDYAVRSMPPTPVVVVSAFADENRAREARQKGADYIFHKPPNVNQLKASIWNVVTSRGDHCPPS